MIRRLLPVLLLGLAIVALPGCSDDDPVASITLTTIAPTSGPIAGGTALTLTGAGFDNAGTVSVVVGGQNATSIVVVSDTTVTCVTPAHAAGAATVEISNDTGTATLANAFTYEAPATLLSGIAQRSENSTAQSGKRPVARFSTGDL